MSQALVIVDVQRDFLPGGALPVPDGDAVIPVARMLAASGDYAPVVATRDWHPMGHSSFEHSGGPWPEHCVQGMPGAELDPGITGIVLDGVFDKGTTVEGPGYSGFEAEGLEALLRERGVDALTIVGLATDYCVGATARDALAAGFAVEIRRDGVRGISEEDATRTLSDLAAAGATIT